MADRWLGDMEERRSFAAPREYGKAGDLDLAYLDPAKADDRYFLILAEHPELEEAIDRDAEEVEIDGNTFNPRLHLSMHELVAKQLWDDEPPEVWRTAVRLRRSGYARHEILHMLGWVAIEHLWQMLHEGQPYDHQRYVQALGALPESWEGGHRPAGPARRGHAQRGRRRPGARGGRPRRR